MEQQAFTIVRIETGDGHDKQMCHVQVDNCHLDIMEIGQLIKQCLLGMGYHWDSVEALFGDEAVVRIEDMDYVGQDDGEDA